MKIKESTSLKNELPFAITRSGISFNPNAEKWAIREPHLYAQFDFTGLTGILTPELMRGFKQTLVWYCKNKSLHHTDNMCERACHLFKYINKIKEELLEDLSSIDLQNYFASLAVNNRWYLGALRGFLKKWHLLGYAGVCPDAIKFLKEVKICGNRKGVAVLTMDPLNGPFTDIEFQAIQVSINKAYSQGNIKIGEYILVWLFMLLGQRAVQYALLKVCDVFGPKVENGSDVYILHFPRAKQGTMHRSEFKQRLITPQVGKILHKYANDVELKFTGILKDPTQAPLFPNTNSFAQLPEGMAYHRTSLSIGKSIKKILGKLRICSERTGEPLHINATRFRRTIGTRAAQEGHGELVIAELLDHTDTQNVAVYVASTPEIIERIDRAIAVSLAPLAQAFNGIIVENESDSERRDYSSNRIIDPRIEKNCSSMGSCGSFSFCGLVAPVACYTCSLFRAWLDGPHEAVLSFLLDERQRKLKTTDKRIASINDRSILAVTQVILECQKIKSEAEKANE